MSTPTRTQLRRTHGDRGASLIIALVFISVFGLLLMALGDFAFAGTKASGGYRSQRSTNYATDAALEAAVTKTRNDPEIGRDPDVDPTNICNPTSGETLLKMPATAGAPAMVVSCETQSGSDSGIPNEFGSPLPYSILTLGDRRTDGTTRTLGIRSQEPAPYNGNVSVFSWFGGSSDPCGSPSPETGIGFNKKVYPYTSFFGLIKGCAPTEDHNYPWHVTGNVFSNSKIQLDETDAVPQEVPVSGQPTGFIQARGGCRGLGASDALCTDAGWDFSDGKGKDPGLQPGGDALTEYGPRSIADLPVVTPSTPSARATWISARKAECSSAKQLVTFTPGIYTSAKDLNDIFDSSTCQNAAFWFKPGTYYFDFRDGPTELSTESCSVNDGNWAFDSALQANNVHQWCIGGANASGYQQIIAGTPYDWDPAADPTISSVLTLAPAGKSGDGPGSFYGLIPQRTQFSLGVDGKAANAIDGVTANYTMSSSRSGSSIWLNNYPKVPRGNYTDGLDLRIAQAIADPARMNTPTVQVDYQTTGFLGLKTTGTCGPYTLTEPAVGDTAIKTFLLSAVNPSATDVNNPSSLSRCLNTGEKINSASVRYNATRPGFQTGSPFATARLDGIQILVTSKSRPNFPRVPGVLPDGTFDPGGNCDPDEPGAQFIFGGDSHVYVPNGGFELCAGPNPVNPTSGKQIGVYGTPALPRLVPTSVDSASGSTHRTNAKSIGEGPVPLVAVMPYGSQATLHFAGYSIPSGYNFASGDTVSLRASYDPKLGTPSLSIDGCGVLPTQPAGGTSATAALKAVTIDVTACVNSGNRLANGFDLVWDAGAGTGVACTAGDGTAGNGDCPELDGVESIVTLTPNNANTTLRPAAGCATVSPNYWYGVGSPDCALLRVDGPVDQNGSFIGQFIPGSQRQRRGRISVKGAIYAPSHVVDIDDEDLTYPIASRGLVVRHMRMRGFKYGDPTWQKAVFNNYVDSRPSARQVAFIVCEKDSGPCPSTIPNPSFNSSLPESPTNRKTLANPDVIGRAGVSFEAQTNKPAVAAWSVGNL